MKTLPSSNEPSDPEIWPTLAEQLAELRRVGFREALNRLIDSLASWAELWTINYTRSVHGCGVHYLTYMRVRLRHALKRPFDEIFWKRLYEQEEARWCRENGAVGMNISSGSGWAMYGVDLLWEERLRILWATEDFERRLIEDPSSVEFF